MCRMSFSTYILILDKHKAKKKFGFFFLWREHMDKDNLTSRAALQLLAQGAVTENQLFIFSIYNGASLLPHCPLHLLET